MMLSDLEMNKEIKIRCPMMAGKQVNIIELTPVTQIAMAERMSQEHCGSAGQRCRI